MIISYTSTHFPDLKVKCKKYNLMIKLNFIRMRA